MHGSAVLRSTRKPVLVIALVLLASALPATLATPLTDLDAATPAPPSAGAPQPRDLAQRLRAVSQEPVASPGAGVFDAGAIALAGRTVAAAAQGTDAAPALAVERAQVALASDLQGVLSDPQRTDIQRGFDAGQLGLQSRSQLVGSLLPALMRDRLDVEAKNLAAARAVLDGKPASEASVPALDLAAAIHLLAARQGVTLDADQERDVAGLGALPEPFHGKLRDAVAAFVAFDAAAHAAQPGDFLGLASVLAARAQLLDASRALGAAAATLPAPRDATEIRIAPAIAMDLAGVDDTYLDNFALIVDIGGDDTYLNNAGGSNINAATCVVHNYGAGGLIDLAGNDQYVSGRGCGINGGGYGASAGDGLGAGFLVDLGGDDDYLADSFGVNGGGAFGGPGFLLDVGGNDRFVAASLGTNGGGYLSVGFLLDVGGGDDTYVAANGGTNGGGYYGTGLLADEGGDDAYLLGEGPMPPTVEISFDPGFPLVPSGSFPSLAGLAGPRSYSTPVYNETYRVASIATNGGSFFIGVGFLIDIGGSDRYAAGSEGANGGGYFYAGVGFLVDIGGADAYHAFDLGTNGGGGHGGIGFLVHQGDGDTRFEAGDEGTNGGGHDSGVGFLLNAGGSDTYSAGNRGTNGGSYIESVGFLGDTVGDDTYLATGLGTNGGGYAQGVGFLLDALGDDTYTATSEATNGGGDGAVGLLLDLGGNDAYAAGDIATNGGGYIQGAGFLFDALGDDTYTAGELGTNGGGAHGGAGFLLDAGGNDAYVGIGRGANGGGFAVGFGPSAGLLLDLAGIDTYADDMLNCADCSMAPKGLVGAQVDAADLPT